MGSLVLLSGGQDSTVALFNELRRGVKVEALGFDYGQDHASELSAAAKIALDAGVRFEVMPVPRLRFGDHGPVVPVRNTILLSLAANRAVASRLDELVVGCCKDDAALFPDCRPDFLGALEHALVLGGCAVQISAPLLHLGKAGIFRLASELGVLDLVRHQTRTCYRGVSTVEHVWGVGCGECLACQTRAKGWQEFVGG